MNNIKYLLKKKGVLQKEFALDIGVSQPTVSDWIKNKKDPRDENIQKIAEYFGVTPKEIKSNNIQESDIEEAPRVRIIPKTAEARILSAGVDKMPAKDRERALNLIRLMFDQYEEYFKEGNDDDDPRL